ncbi:hypothetical protein [Methylorubrum extorquens]|uniref:Uncharacterized protein n=1 Tax=Methylorubrum extorquens (strain CM4 / NCIMB 13688) TaxID=440085 RepID=B7KRL3_METC4|nr:hypothetical protein [Methylorubrum extorquens]ACK85540.1 hypothetical protein Mchl_4766 [Methylorubrum extorquens CM4]
MPNYTFNRLTLSGPLSELMHFESECIRVQRDDPSGARALDLEAIVPVPPEIVATFDDQSNEAQQTAVAATGCENWRDWCIRSWGTKWNTCHFDGRMIDELIYDCVFDTAWSCPEPALRVLAAKYPALSGTIVACDPADDWCLIGTIQHGFYSSSASAYDPQIDLLMWAGYREMAHPGALIHALIECVSGGRAGEASRDMAVPECLRTIFADLDQRLPYSLRRRIYFERAALDVLALLEAGQSIWDIRERNLVQHPGSAEDVAFLLGNDRMRTPLDRQLLIGMATALRDDALAGCGDNEKAARDRRTRIEHEVLPDHDEDDLRAWAAVAMYRPGVLIDMGSLEALERSVLDYGDHLHADMLAHLSGGRIEVHDPIRTEQAIDCALEARRLPPQEGVRSGAAEVGSRSL